MSISDLILLGSIGLALWYVPRYLWRVYGGAEYVKGLTALLWAQPDDRPSSHPSSSWVEPAKIPETYQLEPSAPAVLEPAHEPAPVSHNMTKKELTILLAVQKDSDGAYRFSANKIAEFVGGTSAEVKGWVADVRGKREPASSSMRRPANGWGKAS